MTKIKKEFTLAQRYHLARLFTSDLTENPIYAAMGSTMKALMQDAIKLHFVPKLKVQKYPPMEIGEIIKKDSEGNITEEKYVFEMTLTVPCVIGMELKFTREIKKNSFNNWSVHKPSTELNCIYSRMNFILSVRKDFELDY